jgi:diadenosine tetraphosphate (Ap4A) HIT family hydrolase
MAENCETIIHKRVALANAGEHPSAIIKLKSGWVVMADTQPVDGYCLLLSDPVVKDLNALSEPARIQYLLDTTRVGDALLAIKGAARINYETWGNLDPALHTHIVPRYTSEPEGKRTLPVCKGYDAQSARTFDQSRDAQFMEAMREFLAKYA